MGKRLGALMRLVGRSVPISKRLAARHSLHKELAFVKSQLRSRTTERDALKVEM